MAVTHPPYHLRPNKAVDRLLFLDVVAHFKAVSEMGSYTYYGMGGPFLDDVRLFTSTFEQLKAVSIERDNSTHIRQKFHKSSRRLKFANDTVDGFLTNDFPAGSKSIFWLDYLDLKVSRIHEFIRLMTLVGEESVVKITVRTSGFDTKIDAFNESFGAFLGAEAKVSDLDFPNAPITVQDMLGVAADQAFAGYANREFQLVHSCSYKDGTHQMLSLTGVVTEHPETVAASLKNWPFLNSNWAPPVSLSMPELSVKERLKLERFLPGKSCANQMRKSLGYDIGPNTIRKLEQYQRYYRLLPTFAKFGL